MTAVVAYDFGRTSCRGVVVVDGTPGEVVTEATEVTVIDLDGEQAVVDTLRRLTERLGPPPVQGAALGLTGVRQASRTRDRVGEVLGELHGQARSVVASDVTIAHAGALGGRPGVVVLAGTGAATLGVSPAGEPVHVDGWGYLLGDAGSGFRIGRSGLAAALARRDGRGAPTVLVELAEDRFGPLQNLPARIHGETNPARLVASFSDAVAVAARAGDEIAQRIWTHAAEDLARSAAAAVERLGARTPRSDAASWSVAVSWAGGLFSNRDLLVDPFREQLARLAPTAAVTPPQGDPLDGAALLARDDRTCHERLLLHRHGVGRRPTNEPTGTHAVSQTGEE
ncbi:MAG: ATPase [Actinobacteria bacterium]|nr:ATPase [Actinomycetota bacterium]